MKIAGDPSLDSFQKQEKFPKTRKTAEVGTSQLLDNK